MFGFIFRGVSENLAQLVEAIRRKREPLIQVPQTQLTFHPLA
jgi:hypothetical protein